MASALDELARAARLAKVSKTEQRRTPKLSESSRAARERIAVSFETASGDLADAVIGSNVAISMLEAAGVKVDRSLNEALRRDDVELAQFLNEFVAKTRRALAKACREAADELRG